MVGPKTGKPEATGAALTPRPRPSRLPARGTPTYRTTATAAKGHGRNGAEAYRGAERIDVPHPSLTCGRRVSRLRQGTVYEKAPGVLVRITGQPPLAATIYQLQKLRCHLCGQVFTAARARRGRRRRSTTPRPAA